MRKNIKAIRARGLRYVLADSLVRSADRLSVVSSFVEQCREFVLNLDMIEAFGEIDYDSYDRMLEGGIYG